MPQVSRKRISLVSQVWWGYRGCWSIMLCWCQLPGCRCQLGFDDSAPPRQSCSLTLQGVRSTVVELPPRPCSPQSAFFFCMHLPSSGTIPQCPTHPSPHPAPLPTLPMVRMQQALAAAVGRAWSFRIPVPTTVALTDRGCAGAAATKPPAGRLMWSRGRFHSWVPIRAASQEASSEMALEKKNCVPCETGKLQPMSEDKAHSLLPEVSGWELKEIDGVLQLHRSWKAKSFLKGLEIMTRVADVAEAEGHHPDLHLVNWNQLSINISTHAVGGLTENDFIVAAKIGALDLTDLVRKPKAAAKQTLKPSPS